MRYSINFCECGRIHYVSYQDCEDWLCEEPSHRKFIHVCSTCGKTTVVSVEKIADAYHINKFGTTKPLTNFYADADMSYRTRISLGLPVILESGNVADAKFDIGYVYQALWEEDTAYNYKPLEQLMAEKVSYCTVDIPRCIKEWSYFLDKHGDNPEDVLKSIAGYYVRGLDWSGTPYMTEEY